MTALTCAALRRTESRGCHRRTDVDGPLSSWLRHLVVTISTAGTVTVTAAGTAGTAEQEIR